MQRHFIFSILSARDGYRFAPLTIDGYRFAPPILLTLLAACASTPPMAPSTGPAPGHWQLVIEVEDMPGTGKVLPQTMTLCSTAEDKKQWQDMVGGKTAAGCTVKDYEARGATISYAMQCQGGIEGATLITVADENNYRGESRLSLKVGDKPATIRSKVTAKRLSPECRK